MMNLRTVLGKHFVKAISQQICREDPLLITRPASFLLCQREEDERTVKRLIILPPKGHTADKINQTNSHDDVEEATIQIKGAVRENKSGFSKLKNCLLHVSFNEAGQVSDLNKPYMNFDPANKTLMEEASTLRSAGEAPFSVVKKGTYGFYHNLINLSDEWLLLLLDKKQRQQKEVDLKECFRTLPEKDAKTLKSFYEAVNQHGDAVFEKAAPLINKILQMPARKSLPVLGEMLYVRDSGRHEACSVFALILKVGRVQPQETADFLNQALQEKAVPKYYALQLLGKLDLL